MSQRLQHDECAEHCVWCAAGRVIEHRKAVEALRAHTEVTTLNEQLKGDLERKFGADFKVSGRGPTPSAVRAAVMRTLEQYERDGLIAPGANCEVATDADGHVVMQMHAALPNLEQVSGAYVITTVDKVK